MRALTYDRYTDASGLEHSDIPVPELPADRVLVRVVAAGLNPFDWHMYRGEPYFMRLQEGFTVRERRTAGADFAGVVEAVGPEVRDFAPGDRVFGDIGNGALAELAVARVTSLAKLPEDISFEVGAATPMAGLTALQALRDAGGLTAGARVLAWGASGGVGHLAVQLARALGASRVDAVCSGRNADMVRALGADTVFDYTADERPTGPYDVVVDTVATASVATLKGMVAPGGRVATVGGISRGRVLGPATVAVRRLASAKLQRTDARMVMARVAAADLDLLAALLADGRLRPVVDRVYPFDDAVEAFTALEGGHVRGKLVVRVGDA